MKKINGNPITNNIVNKNYRVIMYSFNSLMWCGVVVASVNGRIIRESVVDHMKNKL